MKTIYLVRHGATQWNLEGRICGHTDLPLSAEGSEQAKGAARILGRCRIDLARSSPLRRTLETARTIVDGREAALLVDDRLIELRLGGWEGHTRAELVSMPTWQQWISHPDEAATPEGETLAGVRDRAMPALVDALAQVPEGGGLLVVSHGGVVRVLLLHLLGLPLAGYHRLRIDCGSVSAVALQGVGFERPVLLASNLTDPAIGLSGRPVG